MLPGVGCTNSWEPLPWCFLVPGTLVGCPPTPCLPSLPLCPGSMPFQAAWAVLQPGRLTPAPPYFGEGQAKSAAWWAGVLSSLEPLVEDACQVYKASPKASLSFQQWRGGLGMPAHPSMPTTLHTQCYVVGPCKRWLAGEQGQHFKLQPHPGGKHGASGAYMKAQPYCHLMGNPEPFYIHHLLCWMYHGPPPAHPPPAGGTWVAGHMCHHKLCLLPWHLAWVPQSQNVHMGWQQKKRKWSRE